MRFRDRDKDFGQLEQELRALRREPSRNFVRDTVQQLRSRPRWFEARARYVLVGVLTAAVLAASASANIFTLAATTTKHVVKVVSHLTATHPAHHTFAPNNPPPPPNSPAQNQYATLCGPSPAPVCTVEVDPDKPSVAPGGSVIFNLILQTPGHHSGITPTTPITVSWTTGGGTATSPADYPPQSGSVTFTTADSTVPVTITTTPGGTGGNRTFNVIWTAGSGAVMDHDDPFNTITITNPPPPAKVTVTPHNPTINQPKTGTLTQTFTVKLSNPSDGNVHITYQTNPGTATSPRDYQTTAGTLDFASGETQKTFTVTINADTVKEADRQFTITFTSTTPDATIDANNSTDTIKLHSTA